MKENLKSDLSSNMVVGMTGCVQKPEAEDTAKDGDKKGGKGGYELALITDVETIDDKSFQPGIMGRSEKYAKKTTI